MMTNNGCPMGTVDYITCFDKKVRTHRSRATLEIRSKLQVRSLFKACRSWIGFEFSHKSDLNSLTSQRRSDLQKSDLIR